MVMLETIQPEIIEGRKYFMSPVGYSHNQVDKRLKPMLDTLIHLKKKDNQYESLWDTFITMGEHTMVAPDYAVLEKPLDQVDDKVQGTPVFAVEVLSRATGKKDRTTKKDLYEKLGIKEYWIVDPRNKTVDVYKLIDGKYELVDIYQKFSAEEWENLPDYARNEHPQMIKIDFLDGYEINVTDIFVE